MKEVTGLYSLTGEGGGRALHDEAHEDALVDVLDAEAGLAVAALAQHDLRPVNG